jgi:hypothetical protein
VVFDTNAGHVTLDDQAYNADRGIQTGNPYKELVTNLMSRGVHVELCGATAKVHHYGNGELIPGIEINTDAMARTTSLSSKDSRKSAKVRSRPAAGQQGAVSTGRAGFTPFLRCRCGCEPAPDPPFCAPVRRRLVGRRPAPTGITWAYRKALSAATLSARPYCRVRPPDADAGLARWRRSRAQRRGRVHPRTWRPGRSFRLCA